MTLIGAAQERLLRLMCFSLGTASLVFLALNAPSIATGIVRVEPWWSIGFLTAYSASALVLTACFAILRTRVLMVVCSMHGVIFLAGLALTPAASMAPLTATPWIFNLAVIGGAAAGVAFVGLAGWVYVATSSLLMFWVVAVSATPSPFSTPFHVALLNTFFMTLFFCIARATWRAGRLFDDAAASAIAEARAAAAASARAAEDVRLKAFVHDSVLVALLAFARSDDPTDARAAEQARRSLEAMQSMDHAPDRRQMTSSQLVRALQALATEIVPDAIFDHDAGTGELVIPPEVSEALTEALAEALRNSAAHAVGSDISVNRRIEAVVSAETVTIAVRDRGRGFDPDHISLDRLGIRAGIIGRMERLPGGRAAVASRPGEGTLVRLQWSRR